MSIIDFSFDGRSPDTLSLELVERKGLGHPDTLADAVAEETSRQYARYCQKQFGAIAHHWFDKVMLVGGEADTGFGRGEIIRPFKALLVGKAVLRVGAEEIPLQKLFDQALATVLGGILKNFDPAKHCQSEMYVSDGVGPGQRTIRYRPANLQELKDFESGHLVSNDCNLCVGFAPYTNAEALGLGLEKYLFSNKQQDLRPWLGSDIKVVVTRQNENYAILANVPVLAKYISSAEQYRTLRKELESDLQAWAEKTVAASCSVSVNPEWVHGRCYLTATGTCLDTGDIGVVGRGNRHSGLITPMRSMSIEASAGKNPLDHTGKLFNILCSRIAQRVYEETGQPNTTFIYTKKGDDLRDPELVSVRFNHDWSQAKAFESRARLIIKEALDGIEQLRESILNGNELFF